MKTGNILFAAGIFVSLSVIGRADTVFSDNFSSDAIGSQPAGTTLYGAGDQYPPYVSPADFATVQTEQEGEYVSFTGLPSSTSHAVYLYSNPYVPTTPNTSPLTPGQDNEQLTDANVGAKFAADTTYTLNYLAASQDNENFSTGTFPSIGVQDVSLDANGAPIAASTQTFAADSLGAFSAGPTVTIDTALDPGIVGENIGYTAGWLPSELYPNKLVGYSDFVLTDMLDGAAVPEPSTYALLGMGALILVIALRRKASAN